MELKGKVLGFKGDFTFSESAIEDILMATNIPVRVGYAGRLIGVADRFSLDLDGSVSVEMIVGNTVKIPEGFNNAYPTLKIVKQHRDDEGRSVLDDVELIEIGLCSVSATLGLIPIKKG